MVQDYILSKNFNGVVIDTNLLLLLFIGLYDKTEIGKHKKIEKYSYEDFNQLLRIVEHFPNKIITTTNILTEVCNLTDSFNAKSKYRFFPFIEQMIKTYQEHNEKSIHLIEKNKAGFYKLGIADTSIINLARQNTLVITDDLSLYHFISSQNYECLNYTRLMAF